MKNQSADKPNYRIQYRDCQVKGHQGEKLNLVCLNKKCVQNSLICSFCIQDQHKNHNFQPLKHFLKNLQSSYQQNKESNLEKELEQIQLQRYELLTKIRQAVQQISKSFQELEQSIIDKYEAIKSSIFDREAKKNRFSDFYESMARKGKGDPKFQIQNYLNFQPLQVFNMTTQIQDFKAHAKQTLSQVKRSLTICKKDHLIIQGSQTNHTNEITEGLKVEDNNSLFVIPPNITQVGTIFKQVNQSSTKTVGYLNVKLKDLTGKIHIKILKKSSKSPSIKVGACKLADITKNNLQQQIDNVPNSFWLADNGKAQMSNYNYIGMLESNSVIDITVKKNHMKAVSKGNVCDFILADKQNSVFFFELRGISSIQIIYPYDKKSI